jgi:hypothetical protein
MRVPANLTFDGKIDLSLNVAFREVGPVMCQPIVDVLQQLTDLCEGILLGFEKRFFS